MLLTLLTVRGVRNASEVRQQGVKNRGRVRRVGRAAARPAVWQTWQRSAGVSDRVGCGAVHQQAGGTAGAAGACRGQAGWTAQPLDVVAGPRDAWHDEHQKSPAKERQKRQKRQKPRKHPRRHAENASDAPLAHERQTSVRTTTSASDGRPVIVHRRHVTPAVVVLGPRPSTCGKMKTRKVLQRSVRSVRNCRWQGENACLHAENASDAPLAHERQKVRQKQHGSVRRGMRAAHTRSWRATGTRLGQAAAVCPRRAGARRGARVRGRSRALRG